MNVAMNSNIICLFRKVNKIITNSFNESILMRRIDKVANRFDIAFSNSIINLIFNKLSIFLEEIKLFKWFIKDEKTIEIFSTSKFINIIENCMMIMIRWLKYSKIIKYLI